MSDLKSRTVLGQEGMRSRKGLTHLLMHQALANLSANGTERGRFELPLPLRADRFSKPAHSTTLPPLRVQAITIGKCGGAVKRSPVRSGGGQVRDRGYASAWRISWPPLSVRRMLRPLK